MRTHKLFLGLMLVLSMVLVACGGAAAPAATEAAPTTPALTGSATWAIEGLGSLSVNHPADWTVVVDEGIAMSNNKDADLVAGLNDDVPADTVVINIAFLPDAIASQIPVEGELTPASFLTAFLGNIGSAADAPTFGEVTATTIGGNVAARTIGASDKVDGIVTAVKIEGGFIVAVGGTQKGGLAAFQATVDAIVASAKFTAAE